MKETIYVLYLLQEDYSPGSKPTIQTLLFHTEQNRNEAIETWRSMENGTPLKEAQEITPTIGTKMVDLYLGYGDWTYWAETDEIDLQ